MSLRSCTMERAFVPDAPAVAFPARIDVGGGDAQQTWHYDVAGDKYFLAVPRRTSRGDEHLEPVRIPAERGCLAEAAVNGTR